LSNVFTNQTDASDRFIEMTVRGIGAGGADSTILPRLRLITSPYSMLARTAVNARNLANPAGGQIVSVTGTNVGINKTSPGSTLDVNGTVSATTINVSAGGTLNGTVTASTLNATTLNGTSVSGSTITASTGFVGPGTIPVGGIIMWSGNNVPSGWALCNGQSVNGVSTPDLRGRFVLSSGSANGLTARTIGQTGGEENHTLSVNEMPAHNHGLNDPGHGHSINDPGHNHAFNYATAGWNAGGIYTTDRYNGQMRSSTEYTGISINRNTTGISMYNTGGGAAHNNMPPFYVLAFIMRVQ
jgi:microcystin-dependent protein